ncbi:MAG: hypothetical protein IK007_07080 [Lachnospiraceae bacterium]|nr:hypothetical protein [Lachnospiraceae bacterium]
MGKQDVTQMKFFRDTKRFADIWNGLAFNGRQVVKWDELEEISPIGLAVNKELKTKKTADIVMASTGTGERLAILIAENQLSIDYSMIVRVLLREFMEYDRQVSEIIKKNRDELRTMKGRKKTEDSIENKNLTAGEYMYLFKKTDRLKPVSTLVLYWNSAPWDGAETLHDLVDFSKCEEMRKISANYKLNIVIIDSLENSDKLFRNRDVKDVVNLYQKRNDKTAFKEYIDTQKVFDRESIEVITEMVTSKELKAYMQNNTDNEGGDIDMCKAITDLIQDGKEEGKAEGKIETLVDLINDGDMTVEKAASKMQITEKEFCKQAEAYGFKLACSN